MANNTISQVEINGTTYDLLDANTLSALDSLKTRVTTLESSVANKASTADSIKNITRSGTTFTATRANGTTFTFTQQDNNTTYGLATTSANGLMSAADKAKLNKITIGPAINSVAFNRFSTAYFNMSVDTTDNTYDSMLAIGGDEIGLWTIDGNRRK